MAGMDSNLHWMAAAGMDVPCTVNAQKPHHEQDATTHEFFEHSTATRVNTDAVIAASLKKQYPNLQLVIAPTANVNLFTFANAGFASYEPIQDSSGHLPGSLKWSQYVAPVRRIDGALGGIGERVLFEKYLFKWKGDDFIVYLVDGRDGTSSYPMISNFFILATEKAKAERLIVEAGRYTSDLHDEVWVFESSMWQKSRELYESIRHSTWDSVILNEDMKKAIIEDHMSFFSSRDTYARLQVPWKRGIIYHGPPGNGKTISIKAMMNTLYSQKRPIPTLYVRSLVSYGGPEYAMKQVFAKAREFAPCYLVFEDLDTIITDSVRSYFLNEVDGLKNNDGIFLVGSTNHLDRLDPGIAKRPSRFDRKYYFPDPSLEERVAYCHFWQKKLADNKDIEFPDELCGAIAEITGDFSFAYIQEAFVAALLAIARKAKARRPSLEGWMEELGDGWVGVAGRGGDLDNLVLWVEIKRQVAILREGMEEKSKLAA